MNDLVQIRVREPFAGGLSCGGGWLMASLCARAGPRAAERTDRLGVRLAAPGSVRSK